MFPNDTKDKHTSDFLSTTGSSDATTKGQSLKISESNNNISIYVLCLSIFSLFSILGLEIVPNIEFSPSKALRVAQMKSRFAETILKAQRHTLLEPVIVKS